MSRVPEKDEAIECLTMTVPEAGARYLGLSPARSYVAAARGDFPVIRVGRLLRVPRRAMDLLLEQAEKGTAK